MKSNVKFLTLAAVLALGLSGCISAKKDTSMVDGDDDADGVLNSVDECPNTPAGAVVDHRGCEVLVKFESAHFGFDSAKLTGDAEALLSAAVSGLAGKAITVAGYTDSTGSDAYNQNLSERRANSVASFLAANGVSADNISVVGYGEANPVASNDTAAGRADNRRVTITPTN